MPRPAWSDVLAEVCAEEHVDHSGRSLVLGEEGVEFVELVMENQVGRAWDDVWTDDEGECARLEQESRASPGAVAFPRHGTTHHPCPTSHSPRRVVQTRLPNRLHTRAPPPQATRKAWTKLSTGPAAFTTACLRRCPTARKTTRVTRTVRMVRTVRTTLRSMRSTVRAWCMHGMHITCTWCAHGVCFACVQGKRAVRAWCSEPSSASAPQTRRRTRPSIAHTWPRYSRCTASLTARLAASRTTSLLTASLTARLTASLAVGRRGALGRHGWRQPAETRRWMRRQRSLSAPSLLRSSRLTRAVAAAAAAAAASAAAAAAAAPVLAAAGSRAAGMITSAAGAVPIWGAEIRGASSYCPPWGTLRRRSGPQKVHRGQPTLAPLSATQPANRPRPGPSRQAQASRLRPSSGQQHPWQEPHTRVQGAPPRVSEESQSPGREIDRHR